MSGHSKWAQIKRSKGVADARRGQMFTKLTREIIVAVRQGGSVPDTNFRLRLSVQKARDSNMPLENIERAIKKGAGETKEGGARLAEVTLEGYGPSGVAILVEALTDNRNRTLQEVRATFSRGGGNLGESGCVAWIFQPKGSIIVNFDRDEESLSLAAIDAGAEDVRTGKGFLDVITAPQELETVRQKLEQKGISVSSFELTMIPQTTVEMKDRAALQTISLLDRLEELDDVQRVSSNADFSDAALEQYKAQV